MPSDLIIRNQGQLPETRAEYLSRSFYEWERHGRGWQVFSYPVELEPPFRPFYITAPDNFPVVDDGRVPSLFNRLADSLRGKSANKAALQLQAGADDWDEPNPAYCDYSGEDFAELQVILPREAKISRAVAEQFLLSLAHAQAPISFEIIGTADETTLQLAASKRDSYQLQSQLKAHFPQASLIETRNSLQEAWEESRGGALIVDFGLSREFMLPLNVISNFDTDPLVTAAGALSALQGGEVGVLQILFKAVRFPWAEAVMDSVRNFDGTPFFVNAPEMIPLAKEKISRPLFAAVMRVAARSYSPDRMWQIARNLGGAFSSLSNPAGNELIPLSNDGYDNFHHEECLLHRQSYRTGMILNSEEIVSLVHPPTPAVQTEKLVRDALKTKAAPPMSLNQSLILGKNEHQGTIREVSISPEQRTRHVYLIGASGSGKSTLLLNLIRQDMENGEGLCLLDPHGDLIDDVMTRVPDSRLTDVILFDPADSQYPIGFNVLQANSETEKTLIASDLVATFRRFSNSWGDVMDAVLANAVLAILENKKGGTLFDLKRLLVEKDFRQEYLKTVEDDGVRYFWQYEYPALAGRSQSSVLVRLDTFLRQKLIRNIVCQKENRLNFRQMMDEKKILLIKLSGGLIGSENAALLGTLLVSKLQQIALSRQDTESGRRPYFWLYLDEFHHFVTPSMESLLSGVRKYRIGLHLAHQEFRQLQSRNLEVAQSVLSNCATRICFRLGDTDAERFAAGFSFFDKEHLQNLGVGEAVARIERAEYDFNLKTSSALKVSPDEAGRKREEILRLTRERFAGRRADVEAVMQAFRPSLTQSFTQSEEKKAVQPVVSGKQVGQTRPKTGVTIETKLPSDIVSENLQEQAAEKNPTQHRYLQELVKRIGEKHGYLAVVEKEVFGGIGKIDVALEQEEQKIACEISVTTPANYELDNIQKCLASGYSTVVVISPDEKHLASIKQKATENLSSSDLAKVVFMPPETFTGWLEEFDSPTRDKQDNNKRDKVKGYEVRATFDPDSEGEQKTRVQAITGTIRNLLKRKKKN